MRPLSYIILGCLTSLFFSCNESLPVYNSPIDVLGVSIAPVYTATDTVRYTMKDNNNPNLVTVTLNSPIHGYEIAIVNAYEETIQDNLEIEGHLELVWEENPELKAVIPITNTSVYDGDLDPVTDLLTINPGDTVRLRIFWDFRLTTNDWAFTQIRYTEGLAHYIGPFQIVSYRFHDPMLLKASVKVKVFRSLSFVGTTAKETFPVLFKGTITYPP